MLITTKAPETWQDLQNATAQILIECGWNANVEQKIETVRGGVEIDVLGIENVEGREYKTLIECKNWQARIPKTIVHSLQTVVGNVGANTGYIISKNGFQAGAYEAAKNSNVELLSWEEFQTKFLEQWYFTYLTQQANTTLDPILSYLEPIPAMAEWDKYLQNEDINILRKMHRDNTGLCRLIFSLQPYIGIALGKRTKIKLPLSTHHPEFKGLPIEITSLTGYREFYEALLNHVNPILDEFRRFRDMAFAKRDENT